MNSECWSWLKLYRKIKDWEWYTDANTFRVYMHLLVIASYKNNKFRGRDIKKGQVVIGRKKLAADLCISEQSVRTALEHLKSTNDITIESTNKYSIITVVGWPKYQGQTDEDNQQDDQQANQQTTNNQPTTNHTQEGKKVRSNNTIKDSIRKPDGIPTSFEPIIEAWNELPLRDIKRISEGSKRYTLLKARIKEAGTDEVVKAIDSIKNSSFLLGQNKTGWTITFDWFIKPGNFAKVLEGNYEDKVESAIDESWKEEFRNE